MRYVWMLCCLALWMSTGCDARSSQPPRGTGDALAIAEPDSTQRQFERVMRYAREQHLYERPLGEIMQAVGLQFLGRPYVAGMLDEPPEETLVVAFDKFDCVLFVETALALARGIAAQDYTYDAFARHLQQQRYRGGQMNGYCSRLHYFSEWIADNDGRGLVENVTRAVGGVPFDKKITFMGEHRKSYPRLVASDSLYQCIRTMEQDLAGLDLYYIPQAQIRAAYGRLQAGDIVAMASKVGGLDVAHTGLVYAREDGGIGLLHASTTGGVKVSPDLQDYVENIPGQVGIVVARPLDSRRR